MNIIDQMRWMADAECQYQDPDTFFPESSSSFGHAKQICEGCPVKAECLEFAMKDEGASSVKYRNGVWGGFTPEERMALYWKRSRQQREAKHPA